MLQQNTMDLGRECSVGANVGGGVFLGGGSTMVARYEDWAISSPPGRFVTSCTRSLTLRCWMSGFGDPLVRPGIPVAVRRLEAVSECRRLQYPNSISLVPKRL